MPALQEGEHAEHGGCRLGRERGHMRLEDGILFVLLGQVY